MQAILVVEEGRASGSRFTVDPGQTLYIGAGPGAQIALPDPGLAPRHAAARLEPHALLVVDLGSQAGTLHNDRRLVPNTPTVVEAGDDLRLGGHLLRVDIVGPDGRPVDLPGRAAAGPALGVELPAGMFEVVRQLGAGAMGRVYQAVRRADGRPVAIKVLHGHCAPGSPDHERFVREGELATRVQSPYVAQVLERRVEGTTAFLVVELIDGPSVESLMARGPLAVPAALVIAEDVARALMAAAAARIVHRDVKPANVLLSSQGMAKLTDFGIAKDLRAQVRALTLSGQGLGTLAYLAPEQVSEAKHVDPRADLYSLGAMLYHMLAGRPPFNPRNDQALFDIVEEPPPPLLPLRPDCPPDVARLVLVLLAKEPDDRLPNARRAADELAALRARFYPTFERSVVFR